jgi:hypothetical protein
MKTIRWRADAGIGDNYMRLMQPNARKAWAARYRGDLKINAFCFGPNSRLLETLYLYQADKITPIDDPHLFELVKLPSCAQLPDEWPIPKFLPWRFDHTARHAITNLQTRPRPWLVIQEEGGTHDGATKSRKCWGTIRWNELTKRWKSITGGTAFEFGPRSTVGLECFPNIKQATHLLKNADLVVCPESAAKYAGPMFNQRAVVLWSKFHAYTVDQQWNSWYKLFDRQNLGLQRVVGIGRTSCKETSIAEVWEQMTDLMTKPKHRRSIALATAYWNRLDYLTQVLSHGADTSFPVDHEFSWTFLNDGSTDKSPEMVMQQAKVLKTAIRGDVHSIRQDHRGCDFAVTAAIKHALIRKPDWVCTVDSDVALNHEWVQRLCEMVDWAEEQSLPLMAISAFNSRLHGTVKTLRPGLVQKGSIGGACLMIRADLLQELQLHSKVTPRWGNGEPGWDWKLVDAIKQRGGIIAALSPSYAQHIGRKGAHAGANFDDATDFVGIRSLHG